MKNRLKNTPMSVLARLFPVLALLMPLVAGASDKAPFRELDSAFTKAIFGTASDMKLDSEEIGQRIDALEAGIQKILVQILDSPPAGMEEDRTLAQDMASMLGILQEVGETLQISAKAHLHCMHHRLHDARDLLAAIRWRNGYFTLGDRLWGFHHAFHEAMHAARHELVGPDANLSSERWEAVSDSVDRAQRQMLVLKAISAGSESEKILSALEEMDGSLEQMAEACELKSASALRTGANALRNQFRGLVKSVE
jgi:hypothetical protein